MRGGRTGRCRWPRFARQVVGSAAGVLLFALLIPPAPDSMGLDAALAPLGWTSDVQIDHQPPYSYGYAILGTSCPSTSFCVAVDNGGTVLSSTDPTGGASAWSLSDVDTTGSFDGVSCPSPTLCVATEASSDIATSTDPGEAPRHAPRRRSTTRPAAVS